MRCACATTVSPCVTSTTCCTTSSCAACVPRAAAAPAAQLLSSRSAALLRCRVVHALRLPMAHCALLIALLISPSPSRRTQQTHDSISDDGSRTQGEQGTNLGNEHKRRVELHAQRDGGGHLQLGTRGALTLPPGGQHVARSPHVCLVCTEHLHAPRRPDCPARPQHPPRSSFFPRHFRSRRSFLMSPTTAHSLGSAPRCRPPPPLHPGRHSESRSSSHAPPPRLAGHQRGQVFLGRCTFLAGRGPQPAP